jgi:hypothetical protein
MDIDSFDKAVRSRCQSFKFKRVATSDIAEYLFNQIPSFPNHDKIPEEFITDGLFAIADACDGSVRMAVQMLQRAVSAEIYSVKEILEEFGAVSEKAMGEILVKLAKKDTSVFADMQGMDMKELFYKMLKAAVSGKVFKISGHIDESWKLNLAQTLTKIPGFEDLVDAFYKVDTECSSYFRPNVFLYHMVNYMQGKDMKVFHVTAPSETIQNPVPSASREPATAPVATRAPATRTPAAREPVSSS